MLKIGDYNKLEVSRAAHGGCYLKTGDPVQPEVYLPKKDTPGRMHPGDILRVFVYNTSKHQLGATSMMPLAKVGEFASLEVKEVTSFGAFLDWGIEKDLFVPRKHWKDPLHKGEKAVVFLTLDYEKRGVLGTCELEPHFSEPGEELEPNQEVDLLVFSASRLGFDVVIEKKYRGLVYRSETFEPVQVGDHKRGFIKKIREDGQIDVMLQPHGYKKSVELASDTILKALKRNGGFLPLTDKSKPEEIYDQLQMSKKVFKKTIGGLYKSGDILIRGDGIELIDSDK